MDWLEILALSIVAACMVGMLICGLKEIRKHERH